jgi:DNA-binding MltR family transcriptional regulator
VETSLFDYHPDSQVIIEKYYALLMSESDRGTILLGVSILDELLTGLFRDITPSSTSKTQLDKLFDSRGPFGELSSKLDIAIVCNLIPKNVVESIHKIRKLRNKLAHRTSPFSLKENLDHIYDAFSVLDKAAPSCFLSISHDAIYEHFIVKMMELESEGDKLFSSREDVANFLMKKPDLLDVLMEKRIKALFVVGISTLAALIIFHREIAVKKLAGVNA